MSYIEMDLADFLSLSILLFYLGALAVGAVGLYRSRAQEIQVAPEPEAEDLKQD